MDEASLREEDNASEHISPAPIDVAIVVALSQEFRKLYKEIQDWSLLRYDFEANHHVYRFDYPRNELSGRTYRCLASFVGEKGEQHAAFLMHRLLENWQVRTVVVLGLAVAMNPDVQLGDVVIANRIVTYQQDSKDVPAKGVAGFTFQSVGEAYSLDNRILRELQNSKFPGAEQLSKWQQYSDIQRSQIVSRNEEKKLISAGLVTRSPQVKVGHVASGPTVVAAAALSQWSKDHLALEMESGGILAAIYHSTRFTETIVLRSISDLGDKRQDRLHQIDRESLRRWGMSNAIHFLWTMMDEGLLPLIAEPTELE